jgi:hypothetical protein
VGGYRAVPEACTAITQSAKPATTLRFKAPVRLYAYDILLKRLAQDLKDMAAALGECIQEEHAVMG